MSNAIDSKKDEKAITPVKQPLPPVQEVEETDLDAVAGGCIMDSCNGTCNNTGSGGKKMV